MKRIDISEMREFIDSNSAVLYVAQGINDVMDYLEYLEDLIKEIKND